MKENKNTYRNGSGNGDVSKNEDVQKLKHLPISFINRLFNITSPQWPRVTECWAFTFFFRLGSAIGWTVVTAAFLSRFGIAFLPMLFVLNATLIMVSTFFFERLIVRMRKEVLMIIMVMFAAICIFFASFFYYTSPIIFFTLIIFAESFFLGQYNVFVPILVGERFTPLESQKTFPFIESGETIGGMLGGIFVGLFVTKFPIIWFLYIWMLLLAAVIFVFILTSYLRPSIPPLPIRVHQDSGRERPNDQLKLVFKSIKKFPFLKSLIFIVMLQWIFMNILEFQFMKAVEQDITNSQEQTIAYVEGKTLQAALLSSPEGVSPDAKVTRELPHGASSAMSRSLTQSQQIQLTEKLGTLKGIFHAVALLIHILVASRIMTWLGIAGSLLINPIIMLMSLVGMFLKFGYTSATIARLNFEATYALHKNAYLASHYAFPQNIRDQAAEFLEGMVRPVGTIIGMLFVMGFQMFFFGQDLSMWIHFIMFVIMAVVLFQTIHLQNKYTDISKDQLFAKLPYPQKLNAIEILAQRGHKNAPFILMQKLTEELRKDTESESPYVRIKLLEALGRYSDCDSLPDILEALYDENADVRLAAAHALMNFSDIGDKFYSQAFSRYRMVETLKEIFRHETSSAVRSAIIQVFSLIRQPDTVSYLLDVLKERDGSLRAYCIYTLGLFHDPNTAYYISPYLNDQDVHVRSNAIVAMWQFAKYHPALKLQIKTMLDSQNPAEIGAALYSIGEINLNWQDKLKQLLNSDDENIAFEAAFALTKIGDTVGFQVLVDHLIKMPVHDFENMRRFLHRLKPHAQKMVEHVLMHVISGRLKPYMSSNTHKSFDEVDGELLESLRRLYTMLDQHEELFVIERAIQDQEKLREKKEKSLKKTVSIVTAT